MYKWLLVLLLLVPIIELWGILQVGDWLGGWNTFWMLIIIGISGAYVARAEWRKVWVEAQRQMQTGQIPGQSLLDGICVLTGGLLLLLPGFFSDAIGILLLLPFTRHFFRKLLLNWLEKRMKNGNFTIGKF